MSRAAIPTIALVLFVSIASAQKAASYYNRGKFLSDQATGLLKNQGFAGKMESLKIIDLYKTAADNYLNAEKELSGIRYHARYNAAVNLYNAAIRYHAIGEDNKAYATLKAAIDLWPSLDAIPGSSISKEKSVVKNGLQYIFPATAIEKERISNYYNTRFLMANVASALGKNEEAIQYWKEVADDVQEMPEIIWESAYHVAKNYQKTGRFCEGTSYAVTCIQNASQVQTNKNAQGIFSDNKSTEEMVRYLVKADSQGCLKNDMLDKAVEAMVSMKTELAPPTKYIYSLGEKEYNEGDHSFGLLYNEYRLARLHNDPDISEKWRLRLNENGKHFSSLQWKSLADYYYTLSYTEARNDALENAKKKERKENQFYFFAVEPTCIPLGQYAASIGYIGPVMSHEFRFGYIPGGIKPFLKSGADTEKVPLYIMTHYTGFQASYSFKFLSKGENPGSFTYVGGELRYTARNYTDSLTYYDRHSLERAGKADLNPHSDIMDACVIFGGLHKGKWLYTDIYGGMGIGYKMLSYGNGFDNSQYAVANAPFKDVFWNKLYVPVRVGLKIGFAL